MEAFLLGECEERLALRIEERLFSDDLFYEQLEQVKASLIARQIDGTLQQGQSAQLAMQALRSPKLQAEIARAKAFHEQPMPSRIPTRPTTVQSFLHIVKVSRPLQLAVAALLVVSVGLFYVFPALRHAAIGHIHSSSQNRGGSDSVKSQPARNELANTFFLPATVLRSDSGIPVIQRLPDNTLPVELQIEVRGDAQSHWSAVLMQGANTVFQMDDVKEGSVGPLHYVSLLIQSGTLKPGEYQILLTSKDHPSASGISHTISRNFRIASSR
jgi:hypothetical protein